jgi:lipopolysaccharide transport system permease protein
LAQFFVFGQIAKMPSDGLPYFLFVLSGNVVWSYFAVSFSSISGTFKNYEGIFSKVYFPRAVLPISIIISSLFQFGIKLFLLFSVFLITGNSHFFDSGYLLIPLLLIPLAILSLGLGMIITSLTTKYRDINHILATAIGLWMYVTPVIFPTSILIKQLPNDLTWVVYINPLTSVVDSFRYCLFDVGVVSSFGYAYSICFSFIVFILGYIKFNKTQRSFIDTI